MTINGWHPWLWLAGRRSQARSKRRGQASRSARPQVRQLEARELLTGTWTTLATPSPDAGGLGNMVLLSDGSVMAQGGEFDGNGTSNTWYKLSPDASGSYVNNGGWANLTSMNVTRRFYASNVLPDGRFLVIGGEYTNTSGTATDTPTGEVFNPLANNGAGQWTNIASFTNSYFASNLFGDEPSEVLNNGQVLTGGGAYSNVLNTGAPASGAASTYFYNPSTNSWSFAASKVTRGTAANPVYDSSDEG